MYLISQVMESNKKGQELIMQFANTKKGIQEYSLYTLSDEDCTIFAKAFDFYMTPYPGHNLTSFTKDIIAITSEYGKPVPRMNEITDEYRIRTSQESMEIAKAQLQLLHSKPVQLNCNDDVYVQMKYFQSGWDGCGGIKISLSDSHSKQYIDSFALLGIPHSLKDTLSFHITTMQPWLKDDWPAVTMAESEEDFNQVKEINRLTSRFIRMTNRDQTTEYKTSVSREDIFLLLSLSFLQKNNVRTFRGKSEKEINKYYPNKNIDYDNIFSKWFDEQETTQQFEWVLDASTSECYIPHFESLPANAKQLLIDAYHS